MKYNIDQFSPMRDTGTDKATEQPAFISRMNNCYVNSGNILPIKLPKGNLPEGWTVLKEIHTADSIICDISSTAISGIFTLVYDKKTGGWEPAAPALGALTYNGPGTYAGINGEVRLCNLLAGLKKSTWTTTTYTAASAKCEISVSGVYILYLVASGYPVISRDGGASFASMSSYGGGVVTDFVVSQSFQTMYFASGTKLWKSTDYGVAWTSYEVGAAIQKISKFTSSQIYVQTSATTGKVFNPTTNTFSAPTVQGLGVNNIGDGNSDTIQFGHVVSGGVLQRYDGVTWGPGFYNGPRCQSDEPLGATKWATAGNPSGKWYDETAAEVKPIAGKIVYLCRTYGIQVEKAGDFYTIHKDGTLICSISGINTNRTKADGASVDEWVKSDTDIIGVAASGGYLIFRSYYYAASNAYTSIGCTRMIIPGIKKVDLLTSVGTISVVTDYLNSNNLKGALDSMSKGAYTDCTLSDPTIEVRTVCDSNYIAVGGIRQCVFLSTALGSVNYYYYNVTTDTSKTSILDIPCSLGDILQNSGGIFYGAGTGDFRETINITNDGYIISAGAGAYKGKIIKVAITSLATLRAYTYPIPTIIGDDAWGTQADALKWHNTIYRGKIISYGGNLYYSGGKKIYSPYLWVLGNPKYSVTSLEADVITTPFYSINGAMYYPVAAFGSPIRIYANIVVCARTYLPIVSAFTKICARGNDTVVMSTPAGITALYASGKGIIIEMVAPETSINFSAYIDARGRLGDAIVAYSGAAGIISRNLITSVSTTLKVKPTGANVHIVKGYGVVLDGYINLIGCDVAPDGTVYEITPSLTSGGVLAIGADIPTGKYRMAMKRKMEYLTAVIDPTTATEVLVFKDQSGMLYKKQQGGFSIPFFGTDVFPGVVGAYTYFPYLAAMFNARFAMAGGFALTGEDQILNGGMNTATGWAFVGASTDGTKVTIQSQGSPAYNFIYQRVQKDCIYVATVNDPSLVLGIDKYAVIKVGTGVYNIVFTTPTTDIQIASNGKGNIIVTAVHAYTIERCDTSVYISDQTEYEEFYAGTGSIQKLPALGIKFTGMVSIGESLYLVRDGSTAKISETGSPTNPFAVVEEFVRQGGQFPFKCLQTFAVVRKATAKGADTGDIYLFSGTDYAKLNTVWNSPYDRPFSYNNVLSAEVNGMTILSQNNRAVILGDSGRNLSIETHQGVEKIGELALGGIVGGDINEDIFVTQPEQYDVTVCFTAGQPNTRKRVRKVNVLPEQSCGITVETVPSRPANGAAAFNVTGRDINVVVDIAEDSFIEGMQFEADVIMPTERR